MMNRRNKTILLICLCSVTILGILLYVKSQSQSREEHDYIISDMSDTPDSCTFESVAETQMNTETSESMTETQLNTEPSESMTEVQMNTETAESVTEAQRNTEFSEEASEVFVPTLETERDSEIQETTEQNLKNTMERVTYMPDFYYEPLSAEVIDRIYGISYKQDCPISYDDLRYVSILHYDFSGNVVSGELICNAEIAQDMVEIFFELYQNAYQIEKMKLIDEYLADDKQSMLDNNTSCFNYRTVEGTNTISKHGLGLAIDINPFYNPYVSQNSDGSLYVSPPGSECYVNRDDDFPHKISEDDLCYKLFTKHGFKWGGHYKSIKDYQHFYKES